MLYTVHITSITCLYIIKVGTLDQQWLIKNVSQDFPQPNIGAVFMCKQLMRPFHIIRSCIMFLTLKDGVWISIWQRQLEAILKGIGGTFVLLLETVPLSGLFMCTDYGGIRGHSTWKSFYFSWNKNQYSFQ